jgi:hypothetical protein
MPPTGHHTEAESSTTAEPDSTTEFFLSVSLTNSGESRTHGEHHGEKVDSLDLQEEILVVSAICLHIPSNDLSGKYFIILLINKTINLLLYFC